MSENRIEDTFACLEDNFKNLTKCPKNEEGSLLKNFKFQLGKMGRE